MVAAVSLARTTVSEPNRSRNDISRSGMSCWKESTAMPANDPSAFLSEAGLVRKRKALLLWVPGYGSPASPRLEHPRNIDVVGQEFPEAEASRLPNPSACINSSPWGVPEFKALPPWVILV